MSVIAAYNATVEHALYIAAGYPFNYFPENPETAKLEVSQTTEDNVIIKSSFMETDYDNYSYLSTEEVAIPANLLFNMTREEVDEWRIEEKERRDAEAKRFLEKYKREREEVKKKAAADKEKRERAALKRLAKKYPDVLK